MLTLAFASELGPPVERSRRTVRVWRDDFDGIVARGFSSGGCRWIEWPGTGTFSFSANSRTVRVWAAAGTPHELVVRKFETVLQPVILQALGWQTLHASAVCGPTGALAFCGARGAGKSTLSFALRQAGWTHLADDALVISIDERHVMAHPLPFTSRLRDASFRHFAGPSDSLPASPEAAEPAPRPVRAIFVLQQSPEAVDPAVDTVAAVQAFSELLKHAHCFDTTDSAETRRLMLDYLTISEIVPVVRATYRPGLSDLGRVAAILEQAAAHLGVEPPAMALSR